MVNDPQSGVRPLPVGVGLLSRRSLVGGITVLGIALVFILGIPLVNSLVPGENEFTAGEPYVVGGTIQITPADGWALHESSSELFTTFTKSGASLVIIGAVEDDRTAEEMAQTAIDGLKADTSQTWIVGDPQTFVTDAGDHGISVTSHTADTTQESWAILHDGRSATLIGYSPENVWMAVSSEMDAMVASIVFIEAPTS